MKRLSYIYLTLPFLLFLFGWVRLTIALPLALVLLFVLYNLIFTDHQSPTSISPPSTIYWLLITVLWLLLSGIGGYAFQNWDHNWRNAVFHDLIDFRWPVYYAQPESGPVKMLVYYVGFWLPSALIAKFTNWQIANFALFIWSFLGLLLVTHHLASTLKTTNFKVTLFLIFFSGLDILGTLLFPQYPTLFPPSVHLEIWAGNLQYSSFTTQLFWVFNQAIPAWLVISVIARKGISPTKPSPYLMGMASGKEQERPRDDGRGELILLWSLCFFFAPLASVGLFPYILIELIQQTDFKSPFKDIRWGQILSAVIIFLLSALFFIANTAAQARGFQSLSFVKFLAFFLLEGGLLWLVLASSRFKDPRWMVTGALLAVILFVQIGNGRDFVMRASVAPLFYLMLMTGEIIFNKSSSRIVRYSLLALLVLGSFTPLYEINRSIYRTFEYYIVLEPSLFDPPIPDHVTHLEQGGAPEWEHPFTLTADEIVTLQYMTDELSQNFIANTRKTFFYKYLAKR